MDEDFLMDFNLSDMPIYAKKSAPPPPPDEENETQSTTATTATTPEPNRIPLAPATPNLNQSTSTFPQSPCSTPSSSILNSSNDTTRTNPRGDDEPMDEDQPPDISSTDQQQQQQQQQQHQQQQHGGSQKENIEAPEGKTKRTRNRSRAKKTAAMQAKPPPDIPTLLANLEPTLQDVKKKKKPKYSGTATQDQDNREPAVVSGKGNADPPPLPPSLPPPPPPPPPPSSSDTMSSSSDVPSTQSTFSQGGKNATRGEKDKNSAPRTNPQTTGAQRTSARIPKIKDFSSQNRQWFRDDEAPNPPTTSTPSSSSSSSSSASSTPNPKRHSTTLTPSGATPSTSVQGKDKSEGSQRSAYDIKPGGENKDVCLDVTSHRFIPEDDKRIEIVLRKMIGDDDLDGGRKTSSADIIIHDFPTVSSYDVTGVPLDQAPGAALMFTADDTRFVSIAEFATVERPDVTAYHTITRRDNMTFILVYRPEKARGKRRWEIPALALCQDFINDLLSKMYEEDSKAAAAYARSGRWGLMQTIVLHARDMEEIADFRRQLALTVYKGYCFDSYPRDVVIAKADISILLRSSMKTFKTEIIPKVLFQRNADCIAGTLRVMATRLFPADSVSHKGESKEHWRSIELKGNEQLLRCLRFIPESKPFLLGYDTVQIRGGLRPQDLPLAGNKRPWSEFHFTGNALLTDPRKPGPETANDFPPGNHQVSERGNFNKRGRPFRGRGRGRFPRK